MADADGDGRRGPLDALSTFIGETQSGGLSPAVAHAQLRPHPLGGGSRSHAPAFTEQRDSRRPGGASADLLVLRGRPRRCRSLALDYWTESA